MKVLSIGLAAFLLMACEKSQDLGNPRDGGGDDGSKSDTGATGGSGGAGGKGADGGGDLLGAGGREAGAGGGPADGPRDGVDASTDGGGGGCVIGGASYAEGAHNPANPCEECRAATSRSAWSSLADGASCGTGQVCTARACVAGCYISGAFVMPAAVDATNACRSCRPATSTSDWTTLGDGTACGAGRVCTAGACQAGCYVGGAFAASGATNPSNACESCQPATSTSVFSARPDGTACASGSVCSSRTCAAGCFIDGLVRAPAATDPNNGCRSCQPATSTTAWTSRNDGSSCGNGQLCQAGACGSGCSIGGTSYASGALNPSNTCSSCQPATSTTAFTPLSDGTSCGAGQVCSTAACRAGCFIAGAFVAGGALNPTNPCQSCQPATSTSGWTAVGDGAACGSGRVCSAVACQSGCFIAGGFFASGALNPSNACVSCQPATSTTAFTPLSDGASCGSGQVCSAASCQSGCFIGGAFRAAGAVDPANPCQRCVPSTSATAWTPLAEGTACGGGKICASAACVPPDVGPCTPHAFRCGPGNAIETCNPHGTGWLQVTTCTGGCSNGACGAAGPCTPGARRCNGGNAESCSADGTTWALAEVCTTYCAGAGQCALDGLQVTGTTNLDGVVYVQGEAHVYAGGTLYSPAGNLTLYADTITVDLGGTVAAAATGRSPQGIGTTGGLSIYFGSCGGATWGGSYGSPGVPAGGTTWGATTDSDVQPGSPGGDISYSNATTAMYTTYQGANGGGVLRLVATGAINVGGQVHADGATGSLIDCGIYQGGGSGGGILLAAETVAASGALSTVGGPPHYTNGGTSDGGGQGRIKVLARTQTVTGTISGVLSQGMEPPVVISSASHPDPTLAYNDGAGALLVSWVRPFASRQGYYVRLDTATSPPPTAANGTFVSTESTAFPSSGLAAGDNYFHIVTVDSQFAAGTVETYFHVRVNASPPSLSSPSHPDQSAWSASMTPTFAWTFPQGDPSVTGVYYLIDHDGSTVPDATASFLPASQKQIVLPDVQPGVWVFHVVSVDTQGVRTRAAGNYRINIGTNPGSGAIVGNVVDGGGAPVNGAVVSVNGGLYMQATNAAGQYNLNAVTAGTWQVGASSNGRSVAKTVAVTSGGVATANFTLP